VRLDMSKVVEVLIVLALFTAVAGFIYYRVKKPKKVSPPVVPREYPPNPPEDRDFR